MMAVGSAKREEQGLYLEAMRRARVSLALRAGDKRGIIAELVAMLAAGGGIRDEAAVLAAVLEREARLSTGLQSGVALPHGRTLAVDALEVAIGLKREGIDFEALDGEPSRIFVLVVSSLLDVDPHLVFLGELSRRLHSATGRERVLAAPTAEALIALLTEDVGGGLKA